VFPNFLLATKKRKGIVIIITASTYSQKKSEGEKGGSFRESLKEKGERWSLIRNHIISFPKKEKIGGKGRKEYHCRSPSH